MYSTCISCSASLGANQTLEAFPVGRRLAFDPERGRLWVLCGSCRSWNLAPLEERLEAVEEAERHFERALIGATTENVAVGRVRDGTELVRIGRVNRSEFAGWRYGSRLLGRWRKNRRRVWAAAGIGAAIGLTPLFGSLPMWPLLPVAFALQRRRNRRPVLRREDGHLIRVGDGWKALLLPTGSEAGWSVSIPQKGGDPLTLEGAEGLRALRGFLPVMRHDGGSPDQVRNAVEEVERLGSASQVLRESAHELQFLESMAPRSRFMKVRPHQIATGHPIIQLALEMAANEEFEHRALQGEADLLTREWAEAEEIAGIADDLLIPPTLRAQLNRWRMNDPRAIEPASGDPKSDP